MGARWAGSLALVLVSVSARFQRVAAQSRGYSPPGWGSVFLGAECWGASASGEGCGGTARVRAHWAGPRGPAGPGCLAWRALAAVWPVWGAAAAGGWGLGSETGCWSISGVRRAARWCRAGQRPGRAAESGEKGFGWTALVTGWVDVEMFLENSGPRDGQEAGFQVSGVLEQVF